MSALDVEYFSRAVQQNTERFQFTLKNLVIDLMILTQQACANASLDVAGTASYRDPQNQKQVRGLTVSGTNAQIGGPSPEARNVAAGLLWAIAVWAYRPDPVDTGNRIQGNFIGTDATGTHVLGNVIGLYVDDVFGALVGGVDLSATQPAG